MRACRGRIPEFVASNYAWPSAIGLNRRAFGPDVLIAPFNFLMGFPNFVIQTLALMTGLLGARSLSRRLARTHLGIPTHVQRTLESRVRTQLLAVSPCDEGTGRSWVNRVRHASQAPIRVYVQTRNVAADITAGTLAAVTGMLLLHQFTPGSISAGSALAHVVAKEQAASAFPLGQTLGSLFYTIVPVSPSWVVLTLVFLGVMMVIAVVAAFSGFIHDPLQTITGIHRRRLHRMLDAIEAAVTEPSHEGYRPKDTFFGRIYDFVDWVKGVLSF